MAYYLSNINRAQALIKSGKYYDASHDCRRAIKLKPEFIKAYIHLGESQAKCIIPKEGDNLPVFFIRGTIFRHQSGGRALRHYSLVLIHIVIAYKYNANGGHTKIEKHI